MIKTPLVVLLLATILVVLPLHAAEEAAVSPGLPEQPNRIAIWLDFAGSGSFSASFQKGVELEFAGQAERGFGLAWQLQFAPPPALSGIDAVPPKEKLEKVIVGIDKVVWIEIPAYADETGHLRLRAREYDVLLDSWGPIGEERSQGGIRLASDLFALAHRTFRPIGQLIASDSSRVCKVAVRGLGLTLPDSDLPLAQPGRPFRAFREFLLNDKRESIEEIPWTYLVMNDAGDRVTSSQFNTVSGLRNPLTQRTRKKSRIWLLGSGDYGAKTTTVRFVTGKENRPVAGFAVTAKPFGQASSVAIRNTDYRGEVSIGPVKLATEVKDIEGPRLLTVMLQSGRYVLASFPLVPGDSDEKIVRVTLDTVLAEGNGRTVSLQEEMVDTVIRRAILQKRMEKLMAAKDIPKVKEMVEAINSLPDRVYYQKRLETLKESIEKMSTSAGKSNLSPAMRRIFTQTESLLTEYFKIDKVDVKIEETPAPPEQPEEAKN